MPITDPGSASKGALAADTQAQLQALIDAGEGGEVEVTPATIKETIVGDGVVGVITSIADSTFSENDVYSNPIPVVLYENYDLDLLSDNAIGIVVETFPYTRTFDESNPYIDNYSSVSDFDEPTIDQISANASTNYLDTGAAATSLATAVEKSDEGFYINITTATYAEDEITGLRDRFGAPAEFDPSILYKSTIESLATEVSQTFVSKRYVFKKKATTRIQGENLSSTFRFTQRPKITGSVDAIGSPTVPLRGTTLTSTDSRVY
jgi:hypothetical protein